MGRALRVTGVTFVGGLLVVLGIILLPLPGPGTLVVLMGLGVLGTEYAWARRAVDAIKKGAHLVHRRVMARWRARRTARTAAAPARLPESRPA